METDIVSLIIAGISILSLIYSVIGLKKTGVTVFLLQIQAPISIIKRLLKLDGGRQNFLVGRTSLPADTVFERLLTMGYQWDYFAYNDDGEQVSMRKLYNNRQVHVRTFENGEIRMHDELNYEFEPVKHIQEAPFQASQSAIDEVVQALGDSPVPALLH
jgi:hypothetical protein